MAAKKKDEAAAPLAEPFFDWSLLWSGSWEESKTLHNRGEIKLNFIPPALMFRAEVLDRRTMDFELDDPWGDPDKIITNFLSGLYHKPTGSRFLYGVLDEWGLSARIRNPWIRSAPYAENHKPLIADLKTAASATKEDEVYAYLSTPFMNPLPNVKVRGFASAQTEVENYTPAFSGGLDAVFNKKTHLLLEGFYTGATLEQTKPKTWFSNPPPLPEREFDLYAVGILFNNPLVSVSSDFAYSETFAWGSDMYANLGIRVTPLLSSGRIPRPLSVSFAVDGAGERFVYRDGANHGPGFRTAGKIELKGGRNSLFRASTMVRGPGYEEEFNRSYSTLYYRFPAAGKDSPVVRLTRISLSADRNAVKPQKITDRLTGNLGISVNLPQNSKKSLLAVNFSGFVKGITASEDTPSPYPAFTESHDFDTGGANCELSLSPANFQLKTKWGYTVYAEKDDKWDCSFSAAARFKRGRLSIKASSPDFPEIWDWTISWRLDIK